MWMPSKESIDEKASSMMMSVSPAPPAVSLWSVIVIAHVTSTEQINVYYVMLYYIILYLYSQLTYLLNKGEINQSIHISNHQSMFASTLFKT